MEDPETKNEGSNREDDSGAGKGISREVFRGMNKWLNPPPRPREKQILLTEEPMTNEPFEFYLNQVGKQKVVNRTLSTRIAEKTIGIAERLNSKCTK